MNMNRLISTLALITSPFMFAAGARAEAIDLDLTRDISTFGAATTSVNGGILTASGINEVNLDGLFCNLLTATNGRGAIDWTVTFPDPIDQLLSVGSSLNLDAIGTRDGSWAHTPASIQRGTDGFHFAASFDPNQMVAVDIVNRAGEVVHTVSNIGAGITVPVYIPPRDGTVVVIRWHLVGPRSLGVMCASDFDFSNSAAASIPFIDANTGEVVAEGIKLVIREMIPGDGAVIEGATVSGHNLAPFHISHMTVESAPVVCTADFNRDGSVNSQDFFDFITALFSTAPAADFNGDGLINSQDYFDFLNAFFSGC